ncbi:MAG TPA: serine hydrolase [Acetobacteraceae bacterium]|nr:serine hydrolase [Acetobacteraceae bacterium]
MAPLRLLFPLLLLVSLGRRVQAEALPVFAPGGPDAAAYGAELGYPTAPPSARLPQRFMVGDYSAFDRLLPSHRVARPPAPSPLHRAAQELALTYRFRGNTRTLRDYLDHNPATGLLIARGDTILFEHYQYGRTDRDRLLSQSMAKTVTAMLVGIALSEGAIRSIDQPAADYVPRLAGTEFGRTTIRDLLHMASGVAFQELYNGEDDSAALNRALFSGIDPADAVAQFNTRVVPAGTRFHYAGIQTEILGLVLAHATHGSLAAYLQSRIWQPMGAEADASWITDRTGHELAFCCISATLRDWARFALLLAHDGAWNGRQIIPRDWLLASTTVAAPFLAPGRVARLYGYGNQVWLLPGPRREFALLGIHGQTIFVDPAAQLVLVQTAVRVKAANDPGAAELRAVWHALVRQVGETP